VHVVVKAQQWPHPTLDHANFGGGLQSSPLFQEIQSNHTGWLLVMLGIGREQGVSC